MKNDTQAIEKNLEDSDVSEIDMEFENFRFTDFKMNLEIADCPERSSKIDAEILSFSKRGCMVIPLFQQGYVYAFKTLVEKENIEKALKLGQEALYVSERLYSWDSPDAAYWYRRLGELLEIQERYEDANYLYKKSVSAYGKYMKSPFRRDQYGEIQLADSNRKPSIFKIPAHTYTTRRKS